MNPAQALQPGVIHQALLGNLARLAHGREGYVAVQRIAQQAFAAEDGRSHEDMVAERRPTVALSGALAHQAEA
jgi:hypothetical protein